jgi:hypothetical protein
VAENEKWRSGEVENGRMEKWRALANLYGFNSDIDIEAY